MSDFLLIVAIEQIFFYFLGIIALLQLIRRK